MSVHTASDVNEAVQLAEEFRERRTYNWFRGQRENWPLRSSFSRLSENDKERALQRAALFEHWIKHTPGLETLAAATDSMIAVGQHYGVPTNFIDFTTSPAVAGFFASENPPVAGHLQSCILCLNVEDLQRFWQHLRSKYPPPEFLTPDVSNLWRLEAQSGVFLFCPYANLERMYDLDRIVFPYTGIISHPTKQEIYPPRKSQLEILLDQYFMLERLVEGTTEVERQIAKGLWTVHVEDSNKRYNPDLIDTLPPDLDSWQLTRTHEWLASHREGFAEAQTHIEFSLPHPGNLSDIAKGRALIAGAVLARLVEMPNLRRELVSWNISGQGSQADDRLLNAISVSLGKVWDGVRVLPYTDDELAVGIANCVLLAFIAHAARSTETYDPWLDAATQCFGEAIKVEFGSADGSYSRSYSSKVALRGAVRGDIATYLKPAKKAVLLENMTGLLQALQLPAKLFEFRPLARVFVEQIVPMQVLTRSSAVFYSPARLCAFGLP